MKKRAVLAAILAAGAAGSMVIPAQAADTGSIYEQLKTKGYAVAGGQISSPKELNNILSELNGRLPNVNIVWKDCPEVTPPSGNRPETPDTNVPDSGGQDTDKPGTDDGIQRPDKPETDKPETDKPETDKPETDKPEIDKPGEDSNKPGNGTDKPGADTQERTFAQQVVDLVNAERSKAGLGALTLDSKIEAAALVRSKEIETSFSHTRPDGRGFSTVLMDNGITFKGAGENIAWGQKTPEDVMNAWMNSEGHRANILNARFTKMGVGYYQNNSGRNFWTQLFTY